MEKQKTWPLYVSVALSVLLSGFAAFSMCFNIESASFPLGVMTLLVTTLVGWQIYSTIEMKKEIDKIKAEFEKTKSDIKNELDNITTRLDTHVSSSRKRAITLYSQIEEDFATMCAVDSKHFPKTITHLIKAIVSWSEIEKYDRANLAKSLLFKVIPNSSKIKITLQEKINLTNALKQVRNQDKIKDFEKLFVFLSKLDVS